MQARPRPALMTCLRHRFLWLLLSLLPPPLLAGLSGKGPLKRARPASATASDPAPPPPKTAAQAREVRLQRAAYRQKQFSPAPLSCSLGGQSFLEGESVGPSTRRLYSEWMKALEFFCSQAGVAAPEGEPFVHMLLDYLDYLFFRGFPVEDAKKLMAAVKFSRTEFSPTGGQSTARIDRALRGWSRHSVPRRRLPLPFPALSALVGWMIQRGHFWTAIALLLSFFLYLRPGEMSALRAEHLTAPIPSAGLTFWTVTLALEEDGKPTKTGKYDEALLLDLPHHAVLSPWLRMLKEKRQPNESLWIHSHADMIKQLSLAAHELGLSALNVEWYCARHGGASHDLQMKLRYVADVKRRLRHVSDLSVRHYERSGKLAKATSLIPPATLQFGAAVGKHLQNVLQTRTLPMPLPAPPAL